MPFPPSPSSSHPLICQLLEDGEGARDGDGEESETGKGKEDEDEDEEDKADDISEKSSSDGTEKTFEMVN